MGEQAETPKKTQDDKSADDRMKARLEKASDKSQGKRAFDRGQEVQK